MKRWMVPRVAHCESGACAYCGALRVESIRTCGALCPRGVDPRLADFLGTLPWTASGQLPPHLAPA